MLTKQQQRLRRSKKTRFAISKNPMAHRLIVHRTNQHMYASISSQDGSAILVSASTLQMPIKVKISALNGIDKTNIVAAKEVGHAIAEKAKLLGIQRVAFDRSGFAYHGRVKVLADAARESGLQF